MVLLTQLLTSTAIHSIAFILKFNYLSSSKVQEDWGVTAPQVQTKSAQIMLYIILCEHSLRVVLCPDCLPLGIG